MATFKIEGVDQLKRALAQAGDLAQEALEAAMVEEAESIMTESKQRAPVDTGAMRASGVVLPPERSGDRVSVTMGYGGASQAYVKVQHENMTLRHVTGEPKFLERPVLERAGKLGNVLASRVARAWQRLRVQ